MTKVTNGISSSRPEMGTMDLSNQANGEAKMEKAKMVAKVIGKMKDLKVNDYFIRRLVENLETVSIGNLKYMMTFSTAADFKKFLG